MAGQDKGAGWAAAKIRMGRRPARCSGPKSRLDGQTTRRPDGRLLRVREIEPSYDLRNFMKTCHQALLGKKSVQKEAIGRNEQTSKRATSKQAPTQQHLKLQGIALPSAKPSPEFPAHGKPLFVGLVLASHVPDISGVAFAIGVFSFGNPLLFIDAPQRCARRGAHAEVHTQRCTRRGAHVEVHTQRCTCRSAHAEVHTQRCTCRGAHAEVHIVFTLLYDCSPPPNKAFKHAVLLNMATKRTPLLVHLCGSPSLVEIVLGQA